MAPPPPLPLPSPSGTSVRSARHVPLLSLAPPALALGDELAVGSPGEDNNVGEIWNVITRAADLVKDGERLENLAWRHWGQPRRTPSFSHHDRRLSSSSQGSASSASIQTPQESSYFSRLGPGHPHPRHQPPCQQRMTFGAALLLLVEKDEGNFKDWVEDAKRGIPCSPPLPTFAVPETPQRSSPENGVQIHLVEPTPVPSRAGSLGGNSIIPSMSGRDVPPALKEDVEEEEEAAKTSAHENVHRVRIAPIDTERARGVSPRKKGKFFFQSSPSKGSGSDSATSPHNSSKHESPPPSTMAPPAPFTRGHPRRKSSGDSSAIMAVAKKSPATKRHVSLTTMRGKFQAEKRKAAEAIAQKHDEKAGNEESGWEDEESDWEDEGEEAEKQAEEAGDEEEQAEEDDDGDWSDEEEGDEDKEVAQDDAPEEPEGEDDEDWSDEDGDGAKSEQDISEPQPASQLKSPVRKVLSPIKKSPSPQRPSTRDPNRRRSNSRPRPGLATITQSQSEAGSDSLKRRTSWHGDRSNTAPNLAMSRQPPPVPAPAPVPKLSKKERQAAAAERAKVEARLDAQRKREMFAKQNVLGGMGTRPPSGLLASALQRGASMVDLPTVSEDRAPIKSSPTHAQLTSLAHSPHPGPSLLRSKSTAAMPVQSGVSVTVTGGHISQAAGKNAATGSSSESHKSKKTKPVVELESDSEDGDDDYLNTSHIHQKLAELDSKQEAKSKAKAEAGTQTSSATTASVNDAPPAQPAPASAAASRALPVSARANEFGVVQPMMTPTTRRRNIIMAEMSESLRRNVVLEREKSSTGLSRILSGGSSRTRPPPSMVPSHHSAVNLTQYAQPEPLVEHHQPQSARNVNPPYPYGLQDQDPQASSVPHHQHSTIEQRKRPAPNVLAGGNLLRPLTRVGPMAAQEEAANMGSIGRTQSSGTLGNGGRGETAVPQPQAPAMVRSATTDGDGGQSQRERREWKRINLMDTSYRIHGW
ncbi:hypothetical protein B9479_003896 [Cryptococcus floricola]|uniref:Nitrogen regulatory protein areA GATA-like domain-containing protein n=1 Tax=Cryptococcus floricola TaxID=2591691 RepID=A0A5D3AZ74_9TREE|nr:hypothetical protein B9479_003896 [Cryptococcus floricola]